MIVDISRIAFIILGIGLLPILILFIRYMIQRQRVSQLSAKQRRQLNKTATTKSSAEIMATTYKVLCIIYGVIWIILVSMMGAFLGNPYGSYAILLLGPIAIFCAIAVVEIAAIIYLAIAIRNYGCTRRTAKYKVEKNEKREALWKICFILTVCWWLFILLAMWISLMNPAPGSIVSSCMIFVPLPILLTIILIIWDAVCKRRQATKRRKR